MDQYWSSCLSPDPSSGDQFYCSLFLFILNFEQYTCAPGKYICSLFRFSLSCEQYTCSFFAFSPPLEQFYCSLRQCYCSLLKREPQYDQFYCSLLKLRSPCEQCYCSLCQCYCSLFLFTFNFEQYTCSLLPFIPVYPAFFLTFFLRVVYSFLMASTTLTEAARLEGIRVAVKLINRVTTMTAIKSNRLIRKGT